ncbi:MAG: hypothetical protein ACE5FB_01995 [Candidatus Binatia bacterium]
MAKTKIGTVVRFHKSSPILAIFHLMPHNGSRFPDYKAGQYIALRRNDCRLTKKIISPDKKVTYLPSLDESGKQKIGPVTHSYSIASAPFETSQNEYLEFYVILEIDEKGEPGRLTESMFRMDPQGDNELIYYDRITGDFTLDKRAAGFQNVLLVGTGTGVAPFVSIIKQLHYEANQGKDQRVKYTLVHANRTTEELDYHKDLSAMEADGRFDFVYLPSVSRPTPRDHSDSKMGKGRANNLLRHIFDMPLKEEQDLRDAAGEGDVAKAKAALERTVRPVLPGRFSRKELQERIEPAHSVIMTCGNPFFMSDIKTIADARHIKFEKEDW